MAVGAVFFACLVLADLVEEAEPPDVELAELAEDLEECLKNSMFFEGKDVFLFDNVIPMLVVRAVI